MEDASGEPSLFALEYTVRPFCCKDTGYGWGVEVVLPVSLTVSSFLLVTLLWSCCFSSRHFEAQSETRCLVELPHTDMHYRYTDDMEDGKHDGDTAAAAEEGQPDDSAAETTMAKKAAES